jgi:hypothetical protein
MKANFCEVVIGIINCTQREAEAIYELYKEYKILKTDVVIGQYTLSHGAFLDKETLLNALSKVKES